MNFQNYGNFTVPSGCTSLKVFVAGGCGGASFSSNDDRQFLEIGGGGSGIVIIRYKKTVTNETWS